MRKLTHPDNILNNKIVRRSFIAYRALRNTKTSIFALLRHDRLLMYIVVCEIQQYHHTFLKVNLYIV